MKNKLTIEALAPYLPYGLNMTFNLPNNPNQTGKLLSLGTTLDGYLTAHVQISDTEARQIRFSKSSKYSLCKPILRPLKEAIVPYEQIPYDEDGNKEPNDLFIDDSGQVNMDFQAGGATISWPIVNMQEYMQGLFKQHFDVYGLINKGLAIDINTLKP